MLARRVEVVPVALDFLLVVLAAPLADGPALARVERREVDLLAPVLRLLLEAVHVGRGAHEVDLHVVGEVDGDGGLIDGELAYRRRLEVARQDVPDVDAEVAARDLEDGIALAVLPLEACEVDVARDVGDQPLDRDRAAQHVLVRHRVVEDLRRAAADDLECDEDDEADDEQREPQALQAFLAKRASLLTAGRQMKPCHGRPLLSVLFSCIFSSFYCIMDASLLEDRSRKARRICENFLLMRYFLAVM